MCLLMLDWQETENYLTIGFFRLAVKNIMQHFSGFRVNIKSLEIAEIDNGKYIKLDIVEIHELDGEEMVGFIKTFWLRILQRKWKKIFKKRKEVIRKRKSLCSLKYREINGVWCNKLRSLY